MPMIYNATKDSDKLKGMQWDIINQTQNITLEPLCTSTHATGTWHSLLSCFMFGESSSLRGQFPCASLSKWGSFFTASLSAPFSWNPKPRQIYYSSHSASSFP